MASLTLHHDPPALAALKGLCIGTTLFVAGSMATTSLQFVPALLLATQQKDAPSRPKPSHMESGRLTPQPTAQNENKQLHLTPAAALHGKLDDAVRSAAGGQGYKIAAMQFTLMSKTAFISQVPLELLTIVASGFLAYHYRSSSATALTLPASTSWQKWAAVSALVTAIFPMTGGLMVPLDHKIARIAGEEAPIETYEDAPPDREMERGNTEAFLLRWNALNAVRSGVMLVAGGVGLWSLLE
ncbi:hypothetical protein LTR36_009997 [Oleoguttula mirabilis]|uniref:DUF1772-domain-containing protein n=1 Tax=Oleoguttula mirabilis TaxID=1507867 RepID=A0AAV9JR49_9PEZI|nr:hypothetical protein LTR36_009997 [Oleoguttula mirabilis]